MLLAAILSRGCATAQPSPIVDWSRMAVQMAAEAASHPAQAARAMTMVHVAMFETLNFIEGQHPSAYMLRRMQAVNVSPEVATAVAAHTMLVLLYPDKQAVLDAALQASLADVPEGPRKDGATVLAKALAMNLYALGAGHAEMALAPATPRNLLEDARVHAQAWALTSASYETAVLQTRNLPKQR
jgi:hypothetical protein